MTRYGNRPSPRSQHYIAKGNLCANMPLYCLVITDENQPPRTSKLIWQLVTDN
jgi:hypothetical protein